MLTIAGIIETDPPHPKTASHHHQELVDYYERIEREEILDQKDNVSFEVARHRLACHTLNLVNVVLCIFVIAGEAALFRSFRPVLIVCEESSRVIEANTAILLSNYIKVPLILIEDEAQLRPVVKSVEKNDFVKQLVMSLFERLRLLEQSSILFRVQHRFYERIDDMIFTLFYGEELINAFIIFLIARPLTHDLTRHFSRTFEVNSFIVLLKCRDTQHIDSIMSRYNMNNAHAIMHIAINLIDQNIPPSRDLLIIISYQAQLKIYDRCLRNLFMNPSTAHLAEIRTSTVDNQGP